MKTKFTLSAFPDEPCDSCGKTPSLQFWRNARRGEPINLVFHLCERCLLSAREELQEQLNALKTASPNL